MVKPTHHGQRIMTKVMLQIVGAINRVVYPPWKRLQFTRITNNLWGSSRINVQKVVLPSRKVVRNRG